MVKVTSAMRTHFKKIATAVTALAVTTVSQAAMDVTAVLNEIDAVEEPVNEIAAATVGVLVVMYGWRKVRGSIR